MNLVVFLLLEIGMLLLAYGQFIKWKRERKQTSLFMLFALLAISLLSWRAVYDIYSWYTLISDIAAKPLPPFVIFFANLDVSFGIVLGACFIFGIAMMGFISEIRDKKRAS